MASNPFAALSRQPQQPAPKALPPVARSKGETLKREERKRPSDFAAPANGSKKGDSNKGDSNKSGDRKQQGGGRGGKPQKRRGRQFDRHPGDGRDPTATHKGGASGPSRAIREQQLGDRDARRARREKPELTEEEKAALEAEREREAKMMTLDEYLSKKESFTPEGLSAPAPRAAGEGEDTSKWEGMRTLPSKREDEALFPGSSKANKGKGKRKGGKGARQAIIPNIKPHRSGDDRERRGGDRRTGGGRGGGRGGRKGQSQARPVDVNDSSAFPGLPGQDTA